MSLCTNCKIEKDFEDFYSSKGKLSTWCKACFKKYYNREEVKERREEYNRGRKEIRHAYRLNQNYGITQQEEEELLDEQEGRCGICSLDLIIGGREKNSTCVDHDHETGKIRGILCGSCNRALGLLGDKLNMVRSAVAYLERGSSNGQ